MSDTRATLVPDIGLPLGAVFSIGHRMDGWAVLRAASVGLSRRGVHANSEKFWEMNK